MSDARPRDNVIFGEDLTIHLDGDGCWPDLLEHPYRVGRIKSVAALQGGMQSGLPSVSIRAELDDGTIVILETSMRLFYAATRAFVGRFGDLG